MGKLDIFNNDKDSDQNIKGTKEDFKRGLQHAIDIIERHEWDPNKSFMENISRIFYDSIPEIQKRKLQDMKNDEAQKAFEAKNNLKKLK